jgi:hypothetical protein
LATWGRVMALSFRRGRPKEVLESNRLVVLET